LDRGLTKIDNLGRIALPPEICCKLSWCEEDELNIDVVFNSIVLTRAIPSCVFCNTAMDLARIGSYYVCESCRIRLSKAKSGDCLY